MIPVRNVYYMLSYAFQTLNEQGYKSMQTEDYHNIADLFAAILYKGVSSQIKRGLGKEYIKQTESLSTVRGRIDINESINTRSIIKRQLVCTYDEFSDDNYKNQILKTTMLLLLQADISRQRKKDLRKVLVFFDGVDVIDHRNINWKFQYNRNNQTYRMLMGICELVIKGLIQTQSDGTSRLMDFIDEQKMHRLYEKFILNYYDKHYRDKGIRSSASQIKWQLNDDVDTFLPIMQTDITLSQGSKILIIDAKYYGQNMQGQDNYNSQTIISGNLYQIFTYVKNKESELQDRPHKVAGMLLYAKTEIEMQPDVTYQMSGNSISVKTLDLNQEFERIKEQLDNIVLDYFTIE